MEAGDLAALLNEADQSFPVFVRVGGQNKEVSGLAPLLIKHPDGSHEFAYVLLADGTSLVADETEEDRVIARLEELGY